MAGTTVDEAERAVLALVRVLGLVAPPQLRRAPESHSLTQLPATSSGLNGARDGFRPPGACHCVAVLSGPVPNLQAVYYRSVDGSEPVSDFMDTLSVKRQVALDNEIDRLNMLSPSNPHLPFPHSSQVDGELRELRCHYGRELYRVLYRRSRNLIILLHIFRKNTGTVPRAEIDIAMTRWEGFRARMDAPRRRTPRPAGHDAP